MQIRWQKAWYQKFAGLGGSLLLFASLAAGAAETNVAKEPLPLDELRIFTAVFGTIKQDYVDGVADKKLIENALKGMVAGLDPHSSYLDTKEYQEFMNNTQGEFGGLGLEIVSEDGLIKVVSPIEDTPAYKAGIKNGDLIVKIDDQQVQGMSVTEASNKMRGKPNTPVVLTIVRKNEPKPLVFKLQRAIIKVQSVKSWMLEPNYGYIRIAQFQERTAENVVSALNQLAKENNGPLKGIILDLRNDPGGLVQAGVGVPAIFLPRDTLIVYTEGRSEFAKTRFSATPKYYVQVDPRKFKSPDEQEKEAERIDPLKKVPAWAKDVALVVLVNSGSASASEIVAGALQDHSRALIVGTQTFGKGSVQTVVPIDGGKAALKLTTARYFTPKGRSIQAKGIVPDVVVEEALLNKENIENPFRIREADLENHLENPAGGNKRGTADKTALDGRIRTMIARDYQLQQALSALKVQVLLANKQDTASVGVPDKEAEEHK